MGRAVSGYTACQSVLAVGIGQYGFRKLRDGKITGARSAGDYYGLQTNHNNAPSGLCYYGSPALGIALHTCSDVSLCDPTEPPTASTPSPTAATPSPTASTPSPTVSTASPTASPVRPWDCENYSYPVQILKANGESTYKTMQLNIAEGKYEEMWRWSASSDQQPTAFINALAYSQVDGTAYGLFSPDASGSASSPGYICRFSHEPDSARCLCQAPYTGYTATITRDGTFYLAKEGGVRISKLPSIHAIADPPGSPVSYSSLGSCGMTEQLPGGRGTGGAIDVSGSGLTRQDMEAAYDLSSSCELQVAATSPCYMAMWTMSGDTVMTWKPGSQSFADFIDFEYDGVTYLIGLGSQDGSVWIVKLDGDGGGDIVGHAYSRVVVDYSAATGSQRAMNGFGAAYRYGDKIYFSSNSGSGIFEVDHASLTAVLDRTGPDACDFTGSHVCSRVPMQSPAPSPVTLRWVATAVDPTSFNDGFNCKGKPDVFTTYPTQSPSTSSPTVSTPSPTASTPSPTAPETTPAPPTCPFTGTSSFLQGCNCDRFECGSSRLPWSTRDHRFCGNCPSYLDGAYHFSCPHCAASGTELKLMCPNNWEVCDVFISVYKPKQACNLDTAGGLPANLGEDDGWAAGGCGPGFCLNSSATCGTDTKIHWDMTMFHKQWAGGDEITIPALTSDPTMYFTMFIKEGISCNGDNSQSECNQAGMCEWDGESCKLARLCPAPVPRPPLPSPEPCCDLPPGVEAGSCTAGNNAITSVCDFNLPTCS